MKYLNKVKNYYKKRTEIEWKRLDRYRMEFEITKKILRKNIPLTAKKICDIGGGPGKYSFYLAKLGYEITLVDLVNENIAYAKKLQKKEGIELNNFITANAVNLKMISDNEFDIVLLMGPIYHLTSKNSRSKAFAEALRILKKDGIIFTSFISKYERLRFLAESNPKYILKHNQNISNFMKTGAMSGSLEHIDGKKSFTAGYFIDPLDIEKNMKKQGIETTSLYGLEPMVGRMPSDKINFVDDDVWEHWVNLNYKLSKNTDLLGSSDHLLHVGTKI